MSVHDGLTREASVVYGLDGQVNGKEVCKIMNHIMSTTYMKFVLRIGDTPFKVVKVMPLMHNMIRVFMEGRVSADVHFRTRFEFYTAWDINEYKYPIRQNPVMPDQPI